VGDRPSLRPDQHSPLAWHRLVRDRQVDNALQPQSARGERRLELPHRALACRW
jgi:hypothetical protein